jgi:hypothetical protein
VEVRLSGILYLVGFFVLLLGERIFGDSSSARYALSGVGLLLAVGGVALAAKAHGAAEPDQKPGHRTALIFGGLGLSSVLVYGLGLDPVIDGLGLEDEAAMRLGVAIGALWKILFVAGSIPFLLVDRSLAASPIRVMPARVSEAAGSGLSVALALCMLVPLNWLASDTNERWDFGYFKTSAPGTSTQEIVAGLEEPLHAYLFFPSTSDVRPEVRGYFDQLPTGRLEVEFVDHAVEPELAKQLKVRDNGYIVVTKGEGEDQQVEKIKIGVEFDSARRKLKKLDQEMRESLIRLARDKRTVYLTVGHGEAFWGANDDTSRKLSNLRRLLQNMNFKVKELGLVQGLGSEVPEDADLVIVPGPLAPLDPAELEALDAYRRGGGALWVMVDPGGADLSALLGPLGIGVEAGGTLLSDKSFVPLTRQIADRQNLVTNKYSTHESVTTLSRNHRTLFFLTTAPVALKEEGAPGPGAKRTIVMRSTSDAWMDKDADYTFDEGEEQRQTWPLAIAASGTAESGEGEYRVLVIGDTAWASNVWLRNDIAGAGWEAANAQAVLDAIGWLAEDKALSGTIESEEDVKIEHTKEGQGWVFWGSSVIFPMAIFGLGLVRLRVRRRGGAA